MSARRNTTNRLTLFRPCGTCGKVITTTADSPWMRQLPRGGKKQAITYFCSEKCFAASYKHVGFYDGKTEQRRKERESKRDIKEKNRRYYAAHREEMIERARRYRAANPGSAAADSAYARRKRKLLQDAAS